ncbi:MAG: hypothetical protein ACHREM_28520, partial [Polyangiales bacterium]
MTLSFSGLAAVTWLRAAIDGTLRLDDDARWSARTIGLLVVFGVFAAIACVHYFRLVRSAEAMGTSRLRAGAILLHLVAATALPVTCDDVFAYIAHGREIRAGLNPYLVGPNALGAADPIVTYVSAWWRDAPTVYGPLANLVAYAATGARSVLAAMVALKVVALMTAILSVLVAAEVCRGRGESGARTLAAFAFNPLLAWEISGQAHNDGWVVLALVVFVAFARAGHSWRAFAALTFGLHIKLAVIPVLGLFLVLQWRTARRRACAMAAVSMLIAALLYLPYWAGLATLRGPLSGAGGDVRHVTRSILDLALLVSEPLGRSA